MASINIPPNTPNLQRVMCHYYIDPDCPCADCRTAKAEGVRVEFTPATDPEFSVKALAKAASCA